MRGQNGCPECGAASDKTGKYWPACGSECHQRRPGADEQEPGTHVLLLRTYHCEKHGEVRTPWMMPTEMLWKVEPHCLLCWVDAMKAMGVKPLEVRESASR